MFLIPSTAPALRAAAMRRLRRGPTLGAMALAALHVACSASPTGPSADLPAAVELRPGQTAAIRGTDLTLTLVTDRAECGPNALCLAADIAIVSASLAGERPFGLTFPTGGGATPQVAGPYVVQLVRVVTAPDGPHLVVRVDRS